MWETSTVERLNVRPFFVFHCSPVVDYGSSERKMAIKSYRKSFPSPSSGVSSFAGVEQIVRTAQSKFHAGRPAGNFGPPVSLFHPALGLFDYHLRHLDDKSSTLVTFPPLISLTHMFMSVAANSCPDELTRTATIRDILNQIFSVPLDWEVSQSRFGIKPDAINSGDTPFFVVEVKNEAGLEGDASLQAALSYAHIATSPVDNVKSFYVLCLCHSLLLMWIVDFTGAVELSCISFELSCCSLR